MGSRHFKNINSCKDAGLPEPEIIERDGGMLITLFKDILNEDQLIKLGLNERQVKAVLFAKEKGSISNSQYQQLTNVSRITATRDLSDLIQKRIFNSSNTKGAGSYYELNTSR